MTTVYIDNRIFMSQYSDGIVYICFKNFE